jgi:hypothetical protein
MGGDTRSPRNLIGRKSMLKPAAGSQLDQLHGKTVPMLKLSWKYKPEQVEPGSALEFVRRSLDD